MSADTTSEFWSALIGLNKQADALVERCLRAIEPTRPTGREIPFYASIETRYSNLPITYGTVAVPNSDALAANSVKRNVFTNGGSRVYVRELSFQSYFLKSSDPAGLAPAYDARIPNSATLFPFTWRWNYQTSITQRWYAEQRVLAQAAGRAIAGNHLAFREPQIIEPQETFVFECELMGGFGMAQATQAVGSECVISMILSGYREGI